MDMINLAANEAGFSSPEWDQAELDVVFLGPRAIRHINRSFLDHDDVTDVITFDLRAHNPATLPTGCLGEILICPARALENAVEYNQPPEWELTLYIVHGLLHLGGWDDQASEDVRAMRRAESRVMAVLRDRFNPSECFAFAKPNAK
ncbi:MAG: rRNA maturation RNase YbeY [Lentisphaeria bacterium]|nr:rRNA maturation RNase YbeY [Lentisphaeria bacterium]